MWISKWISFDACNSNKNVFTKSQIHPPINMFETAFKNIAVAIHNVIVSL